MTKNNIINLQELLGSTTKISVLRALYKYRNIEKSIRSIAMEAKVSPNNTNLIMYKYKDLKIVTSRTEGKSNLVKLKNNNVYYEFIKNMFNYEERISERIKADIANSFKAHGLDCNVWVFGSFARNQIGKESDIDILALFSSKYDADKYKHKINEIQDALSEYYLRTFSILVLGLEEYKKDYKSLLKNIEKDGELVYGKDR